MKMDGSDASLGRVGKQGEMGTGRGIHMPHVVYEGYKGGRDVNLALIQAEERTRRGSWEAMALNSSSEGIAEGGWAGMGAWMGRRRL